MASLLSLLQITFNIGQKQLTSKLSVSINFSFSVVVLSAICGFTNNIPFFWELEYFLHAHNIYLFDLIDSDINSKPLGDKMKEYPFTSF